MIQKPSTEEHCRQQCRRFAVVSFSERLANVRKLRVALADHSPDAYFNVLRKHNISTPEDLERALIDTDSAVALFKDLWMTIANYRIAAGWK